MKYTFVLHTTTNNSIPIVVDSCLTTKELYALFMHELESNTIFQTKEILDIFAHDKLSNNTLSFPKTDDTIEKFIHNNREYYPLMPVVQNKYDLYVIDIMYNEHLSRKFYLETPQKTIKTNHMDHLFFSIRKYFRM